MSKPLVALTGLIYAYVGYEQAMKGNWPMATTYLAYSLANVGLFFCVR